MRSKLTPDQTIPIRKWPLIRLFTATCGLWWDHLRPKSVWSDQTKVHSKHCLRSKLSVIRQFSTNRPTWSRYFPDHLPDVCELEIIFDSAISRSGKKICLDFLKKFFCHLEILTFCSLYFWQHRNFIRSGACLKWTKLISQTISGV